MKKEFLSRFRELTLDEIQKINSENTIFELNNVLEGFEKNLFQIGLKEDGNIDEYSLMYVGNHSSIRGFVFNSGRGIIDRDFLTFRFTTYIEKIFPNLNSLVLFNTYQNQIKSIYEKYNILCIPNYLTDLKFCLIAPTKKSIEFLLFVNILDFYKTFFERTKKINDLKNQPKIYLMYSQTENMVKIGETKNLLNTRKKGVAEPTLRAKDQYIEIITAWSAPKNIEAELKKTFTKKRIRGEWFDLRPNDLVDIDKFMSKYEMVYC